MWRRAWQFAHASCIGHSGYVLLKLGHVTHSVVSHEGSAVVHSNYIEIPHTKTFKINLCKMSEKSSEIPPFIFKHYF